MAISAAAVCISVLIVSVRQLKPDMAQLLSIGSVILIMAYMLPYAAEAVKYIKEFSSLNAAGQSCIEPILKITGIAYITQLGAELCADSGEKSLAGRVEMAGKLAICVLTIPIAREAFEKIIGIIR